MQVCPSASCINMDLFWFLEARGCVCASDTLHDISRFGSTGAQPPQLHPLGTAIGTVSLTCRQFLNCCT